MLLDPILASGIITQWDFKMYDVQYIYMMVFDAWLTSHGGMKGWDPVMSQRKIGKTISQYHNYRIIIVDLKEFVTGKPHICWAKKV
jgi:hypothetical protein